MTDCVDTQQRENTRTYRSTPTAEMVTSLNGNMFGKSLMGTMASAIFQNSKRMPPMTTSVC